MKPAVETVRSGARPGMAGRLARLPALLLLAILPGTGHAVEEPAYTVLQTFPAFEIRHYAPYTVAEVVVPLPASDAGNRAFPILAGYIFGKNKGERKLEMTAPVTQTPVPVKLEMTAPVIQQAGGGDPLFRLLVGCQLQQAPEPAPGRNARGEYRLEGRACAVALQQPDDALVHAAQRDLAEPRLRAGSA